jgi:Tfp pilus assembly protein FimT
MSLATITRDIINGNYSNDELNEIAAAIKFARSQITKQNRRSLVVGTRVKFTSSRTGGDITGVVDKVAIKFITVRSSTALWKVPANMLTVA